MPPIRKPYDAHERRPQQLPGKTMTQQHFKDECDVNTILKRYARDGLVSHLATRPGAYMDLPDSMELQDAIAIMMRAQEDFDALPSAVRKEFDNDPAKFLAFAEDPENTDRMREMGLLPPLEGDQGPSRPQPSADPSGEPGGSPGAEGA